MIACASCGYEAPDDFAFCPKCGGALTAPPAAIEERKVVTTLFCDLVGFTAMSERADPEDIEAVLRAYHEAARKVIESHGGSIEKFIGDAVVGVFGVPAAHEDDAERAVRAGLRILEALEGVTRPDGSPLQARCGVNTGEALVRLDVDPASGRGFLTGDAVNTAARLQAASPPGAVAVGALTHELTSRVIVYDDLPAVTAKGKTQPVAVWLATGSIARRGLDPRAGDLTPLVGRQVELSYVTAVFDQVCEQSAPQFVLLVGEPGIGKSRLVREFFRLVDERPRMTTWRQGYCPPFGEDITFRALAEIIRGHAGIRDTDRPEVIEAKLEAVLPSGADSDWFRQRLRALLGLAAPGASREENFTAWLRFFEEMAAARPTVLVFEDLHWADAALLAFLEHLATHLSSVPLLIVGTSRPDLFERDPAFASGGSVVRIPLGPLSSAETARLVTGLLAEHSGRTRAVDELVRLCDGNPFYAEQSARLLVDTSHETSLPDSVQAVIAARMDKLPPGEKAVLADASVVGSVFWDGALAAMQQREPQELEATLSGLLERRLVRRIRESSIEGDREFAFVHALARDVVYQQLPRRARARRHGAVACWLEVKSTGHSEDLAELLAHHYSTAYKLARAAGASDLAVQMEEPALRFLTLAGDRTVNLDLRAAERWYVAALGLAAGDSPEHARIELKLGEAALWSGRCAEAAERLQRAAIALRAAGDVRGAAIALVRQARAREALSDLPEDVESIYVEASALLDGDGPSNALVTVLTEWGRELENAWRLDDAVAIFERALEVACELGVPEPALALSLRASIRGYRGDVRFLDDYRRALAIAEMQGLGVERMRILSNYALDICLIEGPQRSLEEFERFFDFCTSRGLAIGYGRETQISVLIAAGRWDDVLRGAVEIELDFAEQGGNPSNILFVRLMRQLVAWWRGLGQDVVENPRLDEEELAHATVRADACWRLIVAGIVATCRRSETARRLFETALAVAPSESDAMLYLVLPEAVRAALGCGDAGLAERLGGLAKGPLPAVQDAVASIDALCRESRGEHDSAASCFADAAARWHDFGVPYEEAQALLGQGRCLAALGRAPEAAAPLAKAREIFARLGARPALEETDEWLMKADSA
jgi:class 3 adenylate cyclase/tetratricopeptide (TPR) repeat protein